MLGENMKVSINKLITRYRGTSEFKLCNGYNLTLPLHIRDKEHPPLKNTITPLICYPINGEK
jgi:hypothetical protein